MAKEFFKNLPDTSTPLTAERLNGLLDGEESMGSIIVEDIESKNMLNINNITYSYGGTITISDNSVSIPWAGGSTGVAEFNIIKNKYSSYTLSYDTNTSMSRYAIKCLDSSGNIISNISLSGYTYNGSYEGYYKDFTNTSSVEDTFELPSTVSSFKIIFINNNSTEQSTMIYSNAQLEKGTIATDYVECKNFGIQNGSNSNGSWTKFEDGTLIYRKIVSKENFLASSELKTTVQGIDIFRSEIATLSLPLNFIDTNYTVSIAINNDIVGSRAMLPKIHSKDTNMIRIQLIGLESFTSSGVGYTNLNSVDVTAIGRWK